MEEFTKLRNIALPISSVNRNPNRSTCEEKESIIAKHSAKDEQNISGLETETKNLEFISFAEELFSINDKDLNIVLEDIDARHRVNIHDRKTEEVVTATESLVTGILHAAGELDPRFKSSCIYSGSFYDDLKVGNADEFDFVARIDSLSQQDVLEARRSKRKRGFVYLAVKDKAVQDHFAEFLTTPDDDPCLKKTDMILNVDAFQEHFIDLIFSAIQSIDIPDNFIPTEKDDESEVTEISWRPHRNGPCATLYLTYICQSTSDVVNIDIDIAPSVAYPGREYEPPVIEILSGSQPSNPFLDIVHDITYASEVMLVPFHFDYTEKSSERSWHYLYSDTWRVSHSSIEKAVFSLFNPGDTEKRLCRILKILKEIHLQGTKEIEQESKSGPLKLLEPPSTRLTSCTVEAVSGVSSESEYETDSETDDEECETVNEESDDEQCEINDVELDDENCEADEEESGAEQCETVAEESANKECKTVAEESDNKECETVPEESDNKKCETVAEESDNKDCETTAEESDNKECETVAEESDNKECEKVGEESDEKENGIVQVVEVNIELFQRDISEDGLGIKEQNANLLKVHSNTRYDITVEKAKEMNTEDSINCVASNRSDTTKTDIDRNPCPLGVPFSQSTDRMVEIIYDRVVGAHYDDPLRVNTAVSRTSYDEPNKPTVEYKIGHFSDNIDSVNSNPPDILELGPPSVTLYTRHPPAPNALSTSLRHPIDSRVVDEYPNDRCQQSKQYLLAPALQQEDIYRKEDISYRDSKPLLKTYMIKMLFLAMKTAYPDNERWEPNQLSSLLKMALCMIYYAYSSPEKGILNFWFQDLIENRVRDSTCKEVLFCLKRLVPILGKKIQEMKRS